MLRISLNLVVTSRSFWSKTFYNYFSKLKNKRVCDSVPNIIMYDLKKVIVYVMLTQQKLPNFVEEVLRTYDVISISIGINSRTQTWLLMEYKMFQHN